MPPLLATTPAFANSFFVKAAMDIAALSRLVVNGQLQISNTVAKKLNFQQRLNCVHHYMGGHGIKNLYATMGRAGWHWSLLGIQLAMDLENGGKGDFYYAEPFWIPSSGAIRFAELEWRNAYSNDYLGAPIQAPILFHTQHPYFRLRTRALKSMRTIVVVRDIVKSVESNFFKIAKVPDYPDFEDAQLFDWKGHTLSAIEFTNSWGNALRWHPYIQSIRYEELLTNPVGVTKRMTNMWGLNLSEDCLTEAFSRITKEAMKKKLQSQGILKQQRVSYRKTDASAPAECISRIKSIIRSTLIHDFGYNYD
jgi:hypothetical protein